MIGMLALVLALTMLNLVGAPHWARLLVWGALLLTCLAQGVLAFLESLEAVRTLRRLMRK